MSFTSPSVLPGNILTLADSDFESGSPSWAALANASAPAASSSYAFTGAKSLRWTATTANDTSVVTNYYKCLPSEGYVVSGNFLTPNNAHYVAVGVSWSDSSHTPIGGFVYAPQVYTAANAWQPVTGNFTSPPLAAYVTIVAWAGAAGVSEPFAIDLMYAANTPVQVLVDWDNPAFTSMDNPASAAGAAFTDITPWVRLDQNIMMSHGRQDAISEIQPGQASFFAENDTGWFTPQKSGSPYFPGVSLGCRTQINCTDQAGNWYTRFDGAISQITYSIDPTANTNVASISCSDVLAHLNRQTAMQCWTKQTVLNDIPWLHWTLNDDASTNVAAETSCNNGPSLRLTGYQSGGQTAAVTWKNSSGGVETLANAAAPAAADGSAYWQPGSVVPTSPVRGLASGTVGPASTPLPSVNFSPALTAQAGQNRFVGTDGYQLQGNLYADSKHVPIDPNVTGQNYTVECWFMMDPGIAAQLLTSAKIGPFSIISLGCSRQASCLVAGLYLNGSSLLFEVATYLQPPAFPMTSYGSPPTINAFVNIPITADKIPRPHHMVMTIIGSPSGAVVNVWLDNLQLASTGLLAGQLIDTLCIGGAYGGHGNFWGNISCVTVYQYALSPGQIAAHCSAGQYGYWEQTTDNCIAALGEMAGIPSFWSNLQGQNTGLTLTEYYDISGSTPLAAMQVYEQAEQGLLFVNTEGQLCFNTRDWRQGYGAPDLSIPADVYNSDLGYQLTDTYLLNEASTGTAVFTAGVDWMAHDSQFAYGTYASGTQNSPVQLPLITWSRGYSVMGLPSYAYWGDPHLNDNAAWKVNTRSQPRLIPGQLTVDLLTLDVLSGLTISQFYGLDVDSMITLPGLPAASFPDQAGANDYFVEGISETVGLNVHTLTFYTSPAVVQRAWKPGDPVYGALGTTTRIGISGPDTSVPPALGKTVAHDGGEPYWPPAFSAIPNAFLIGSANVTSASPVITVNHSSTQGDCILVQVLAPVAATITVIDSQLNAYAQIRSVTLSTNQVQYLFASFGGQTLSTQAADTITVSASSSQQYTTTAFNIQDVIGTDGSAVTATGTSASPAVTFGTLSAKNDFQLVSVSNHAGYNCSIPAGWTLIWSSNQGLYSNQLFWKQATSTTGGTFSGTLSGGSTPWGTIGVPFLLNPFSMNNPSNNGHQFVGATEIRGIRDTLATALNPPLLAVGMVNHTQTYGTGNNGVQNHATWDVVFADTASGMGIVPAWPNWYCVTVPGFYEISASFPWTTWTTGAVGVRAAWIVVAQSAAQQVAAGTGSPYTDTYVCPIGEQLTPNNASRYPVLCPTTRLYLGVGDMVNIGVMQNQTANDSSSNTYNGPVMSVRWCGYNTSADRVPMASAPGSGTPAPPAGKTTYTKTYNAVHTYSYYGTSSSWTPQLRSTDGQIFQSTWSGGGAAGSMFGFALFNYTQIASDLSGATVNSIKLTMTNQHSWYNSGVYLMVGWSTSTTFGSSFTPGGGTHFNWKQVHFGEGQTLTADITGAGIGAAFATGGATALAFGNNSTQSLNYYGYWTGGTNPKLTITYTK